MDKQVTIYTVGHSTRSLQGFTALLDLYHIKALVDVRSVPRSRHNPQFNRDALSESLPAAGIRYLHLKELGGLRKALADSPNMGWRNLSFRGFADYMQTEQFAAALAQLVAVAKEKATAIMCAEAVPWRCHRSLISDALVVAGVEVQEILDEKHLRPHQLSGMARVEGGRITYPG